MANTPLGVRTIKWLKIKVKVKVKVKDGTTWKKKKTKTEAEMDVVCQPRHESHRNDER